MVFISDSELRGSSNHEGTIACNSSRSCNESQWFCSVGTHSQDCLPGVVRVPSPTAPYHDSVSHDRCEPMKTFEMLHFLAENKPLGTYEQLLTAFILLVWLIMINRSGRQRVQSLTTSITHLSFLYCPERLVWIMTGPVLIAQSHTTRDAANICVQLHTFPFLDLLLQA